MTKHVSALSAPAGPLSVLDTSMIDAVVDYARESPRRRGILPFHKTADEPLQRMLNAVQPGTYVRPHRHVDPPKAEVLLVLRGSVVFFTFDEVGRVTESVELRAGSPRFGVDLASGIYHTLIATEPDTVLYEVKNGPYSVETDKVFAPWAPAEGEPEVAAYVDGLMAAHRARTTTTGMVEST